MADKPPTYVFNKEQQGYLLNKILSASRQNAPFSKDQLREINEAASELDGNMLLPHTVEQGQSLSKIAQTYGIGDWRVIAALNNIPEDKAHLIHPGQVLKLPKENTEAYPAFELEAENADSVTASAKDDTVTKDNEKETHQQYIVKTGDTLSQIAKAHGLDQNGWREIQSLSGIQNANRIYAGQVLTLPAGIASLNPPKEEKNMPELQTKQTQKDPQVVSAENPTESENKRIELPAIFLVSRQEIREDPAPKKINTLQRQQRPLLEKLDIDTSRFNPALPYGITATKHAVPFDGIVMHVTGYHSVDKQIEYSQNPASTRGGYMFGYHYIIDKSGDIIQTAPLDKRTNHVLGDLDPTFNNNNTLGIGIVGGDRGATDAQKEAAKQLVSALREKYDIPLKRVKGHGHVQKDRENNGLGTKEHPEEGADVVAYIRKNEPIRQRYHHNKEDVELASFISPQKSSTIPSAAKTLVQNGDIHTSLNLKAAFDTTGTGIAENDKPAANLTEEYTQTLANGGTDESLESTATPDEPITLAMLDHQPPSPYTPPRK